MTKRRSHHVLRAVSAALLGLLCRVPSLHAETIEFPIYSRTIFFLPVWVADQRGFLRDEGLDLAYGEAKQDEVAERLKAGTLGVNILGPETVYADPSASLRVVAGDAGRLPHFIIAQPRIKSLADLRGATFGVISENEGTTHVIPEIARRAGLGPDDYRMAAVGSAPTRWALLKAGKIDAGLQPFPLSYEAEAAGFTNLGWTGDYEPDWQFTAVVANKNWAEAHRRTLVGFLRALRRATMFIATRRDEAATIAAAEMKSSPDDARRSIDEAFRLRILDETLALNEAGMRRVFEVSPKAANVSAYDPDRFVDLSYLRESGEPPR